jgi:hypothetical protein
MSCTFVVTYSNDKVFEVKGFLVGLCKGVLVAFVKFLALGLIFGPSLMGWWFFFIIWHELEGL